MASRHDIEHITTIACPVDEVWSALLDLENWETWNDWTTLEPATTVKEGAKGKLKACYEGDGVKFEYFNFEFGPVDKKQYILTWFGRVGPCGSLFQGYHTMKLEAVNNSATKLIHKENFRGLLPFIGLGLPYRKLKINYLKMNMALKKYLENNGHQDHSQLEA